MQLTQLHDRDAKRSNALWLVQNLQLSLRRQLLLMVVIAFGTLAPLLDPFVMKWLIDTVLPARSIRLLMAALAVLLVSYIGRGVLLSFGARLALRINQAVLLKLRRKMLAHLTELSADYHDRTSVGTKLFHADNAVEELGSVTTNLLSLAARSLLTAVVILTALCLLNWRLTLLVAPLLPLFLIVVYRSHKPLKHSAESVQKESAAVRDAFQEHLATVPQVQLLNIQRRQMRRLVGLLARLARMEYGQKTAEMSYSLITTVLVVGFMCVVFGYGGLQVFAGALSIGGLVAYYGLIVRLFEPLYMGVEVTSRIQRLEAIVGKIRGVLDTPVLIRDSRDATPLARTRSGLRVECQNVSFSYRGARSALKDVSLLLEPGSRIAIAGETGSGKSTIGRLLVRLYDIEEGRILLDGTDLRRIRLESLRSRVCYLPQHAVLFNLTMEENISLGNPNATTEAVREAAEAMSLLPVVHRLPGGWDEPLGPAGALLSGGERQRVALARALLQRPRMLILDESTAELDAPTERDVLRRLNALLPDTTLIIISHRLPSLTWVDEILCTTLRKWSAYKRRRALKRFLQRFFERPRMKAEGARMALERHAPRAIDYIQAVRPAGVIRLGGVAEIVDQRRNLDVQIAHAAFGHGAALLEILR
jgi:ABC-type bacteriocin/lantibiotic exporter with double-glycine peptidase domain